MGWKCQADPVTGKWLFCVCRSHENRGLDKQEELQAQIKKLLITHLTVTLISDAVWCLFMQNLFKRINYDARVHEKSVTTWRIGWVNNVRTLISRWTVSLKTTDLSQNYHLVVSLVCFSGRAGKNNTLWFVNHPKKQKNRAITHISSSKQNHWTLKHFNRS